MKTFSGYHHARVIAAGESYDERNIGTEEYPVLAPRRPRGIRARPEDPQGLIAKDTLCYVSGSRFVMDGRAYDLNLSTDPADCPKKMVSMGPMSSSCRIRSTSIPRILMTAGASRQALFPPERCS